jgi:hypothetical protein
MLLACVHCEAFVLPGTTCPHCGTHASLPRAASLALVAASIACRPAPEVPYGVTTDWTDADADADTDTDETGDTGE